MIKAIFFDIDGTLIDTSNFKVPESTKLSLLKCKEKGIKIFLATGRPYHQVKVVDHIGIEFDGCLAINGQYCVMDDEVLFEKAIDKDKLESVLRYSVDNNIAMFCATENDDVITLINDRVYEFYEQWESTDWKQKVLKDPYELLNKKVYQLCIFMPPEEEDALLEHFDGYRAARWNDYTCDLISTTYGGKAKGIERILDKTGIKLEETMAFGDGGNDIDMLEFAHIGIAMGNAKDNVKEKADYVTTSVSDNGIYNALKHFNVID